MESNPKPLNVLAVHLLRSINSIQTTVSLFEKLLKKGMNPNLLNKDGAAAIFLKSVDLIDLLYRNGSNMSLRMLADKNNLKFKERNYAS